MPLSQKQLEILRFRRTHYDFLICEGSVRSGKTSLMTVGFHDDAMERFNGQRFGICGKTVDSAIKNIIEPYISMRYVKESYQVKWSRSSKTLTLTKGNVTNIFEVFGGKDESSYMLIQGRTLAGCLIDEVVLQPKSFVDQAVIRCSVTGSKIWFSCNPAAPSHWFYQEWVLKADKGEINAKHLHFVLWDNPGLSEETIHKYETAFTGVFYQRYVLGRWVAAEGIIYQVFANSVTANDGRFLWPKDRELHPWRIFVGVDFGGNGSKHAFVAVGILPGWSGVVALASRRVEPYGKDADFLANALIDFCTEVFLRYGEIQYIFCDSAEQTLISHLRSKLSQCKLSWLGSRVENSAKIEIINRIRLTSILMGSGRFWYTEQAESLRDALAEALWSQKHPGVDERLDDGTTDIDSLDAFEYTIERFYHEFVRR